MKNYGVWIILGVLITLTGVLLSTILRQQMGGMGFILVAVGGFLVTLGLYQKRRLG